MFRRPLVVLAAALTAATMSPLPASAHQEPKPADMYEAMRRDLGLTDEQIADRLTTEAAAPVIENRLRRKLGDRFADTAGRDREPGRPVLAGARDPAPHHPARPRGRGRPACR